MPPLGTAEPVGGHGVDALPTWLEPTYARMLLVSRAEQAADAADGTLIVCCDWLAWRDLVDAGRHAVHFQSLWPETDFGDLRTDLFLTANSWIYDDDKDLTEFHGVSLGRLFVKEVALAILERARLRQSLATLTRRFGATEIVVRAFYTERGLLNSEERHTAIVDAAAALGIDCIDERIGEETLYDELSPEHRVYGIDPSSDVQTMSPSAALFEWAAVAVGGVRRLFAQDDGAVLMLATQLNGSPLLRSHGMGDPLVQIIARNYPGKRNLGRFFKDVRRGLIPVALPPRPTLSDADRSDLARIERDVRAVLAFHPDPHIAGAAPFIVRHVFDEGRIRDYAMKVHQYAALLRDARPSVIVTDGLQNVVANICMELGGPMGISSAVMWHGPYFDDMKMDVFGSDPRRPAVADVCFTWGRQQERYLDETGATCARVRTGSMVAEAVNVGGGESPAKVQHILLLQYSVTPYDTLWPHAQQYSLLAECAAMLRDEFPNADIRVKLHPGPPKVSYFERILRRFGIDAAIRQQGAFVDHLAWADIVIGPMHSGAMLEAMAAGRPFYPLLVRPTNIPEHYARELDASADIHALRERLRRGDAPDHGAFRRYVLSEGEVSSPARRVWESLRDLCAGNGKTAP